MTSSSSRITSYQTRLLTLSPEAMDPSEHFDSLASLGLQVKDFNLQMFKSLESFQI